MAHGAPAQSRRVLALLGCTLAAALLSLLGLARAQDAGAVTASDDTRPITTVLGWTESSPYAHQDASDVDRLWFNPNFDGSAVAVVSAEDPESGIRHVAWPTPPAGWSPPGGTSSTSTGGGRYERAFTWSAGAAAGTVQVTSTHNATSPASEQTSDPVPLEFVVDQEAPTVAGGGLEIHAPGWFQDSGNRLDFPPAADFSDSGSSAAGSGRLQRLLQRRDGVRDADGGCDTSGGSWTTIVTNPTGTSIVDGPASIPARGTCSEFRYRIVDQVGNELDLYASGFRGWDLSDGTPGVTVAPVAGLTLDEADAAATVQYSVVLDSQPADDVTVTVVGDADGTPSPTSLTFTPADWSTPRVVTVAVVDDAYAEGPHSTTISHIVSSSGDATYASAAAAAVVVDVVDDDVPAIEVEPSGPLAVAEGGAGATYRIRLGSEPTAPVTVSLATGSQLEAIPDLVFTSTTWSTFQEVAVAAVQDDLDEATPHRAAIVHAVASGDPVYDGWALADMAVDIADDDSAELLVDLLDGVTVDEANAATSDTVMVRLASRPTAPITVTPAADGQVTTSGPLTFEPDAWSTAQALTIAAADDAIDEADPHDGVVVLTAAGDARYDAAAPKSVVAAVRDDDTAGVTVSPGMLRLDEATAASDAYTIVLDSQPTETVTIGLTTDGQVDVSPTTATFTPATWNTPRTITAVAVDDRRVEQPFHAGVVTHSSMSTDPDYAGIAITSKVADIADDDVAGVVVDDLGGVSATEGGATGSYQVRLAAQPSQDVVVTIAGDAQASPAPSTLTFTAASWDVPQVVTVTALDDAVQEANPHAATMTHSVSSADPLWSGITSADPVEVSVFDDDVAAIVVSHSSPYALAEDTPAATAEYGVVLATQPTADVVVTLTVPADLSASATVLTFTAADWNRAQVVTVGAVDDTVTEAPVHARTITHAVSSADVAYDGFAMPDIRFDVTDNDMPGIVVDRTRLAVVEGGVTDAFSVVLTSRPDADVTLSMTGTQVGVDVDPVTFTPNTWDVPQRVVVSAIDDAVDEGSRTHAGLVRFAVASADPAYDGWSVADLPVDVTDDDVAGVTLAPTGTPLAIDEASSVGASYSIVLDSQPTADVTVTLTTADGQSITDRASVTFTPATWNAPQAILVRAVDDDVDEEDPHPALVAHAAASTDPTYAGLPVPDQPLSVSDDDTAGISVAPTALALDEAAPATTRTFDVVLRSRPLADVVVQLDTGDGQSAVDHARITFTPATWAVPRTITVSVVDDDVAEAASHAGRIVTTASSSDPAYAAIDPADVLLDIADDDVAGILLSESAGSTDVVEGGGPDTYEVVLRSRPTADVVVAVTAGPQASAAPDRLTFTPASWNQPQVVSVTATQDDVVEGPHVQVVGHAVTSGDPAYDGIAISDVVANVSDDDVAGATVTPVTVAVAEGGAGASYRVVLDARPAANVTISVTPDAQLAVGRSTLVFTPADWDVPQSVAVTAVDDAADEADPHAGTITHAMSSTDSDFNVPVADVTAAIGDDDVAGVRVTPATASIAEGGPAAAVEVVLDSAPTGDVDVSFTEPGQLEPIATVRFTPATWNVARTIDVVAVQDLVAEGPHATTVTVATDSGDPNYATGSLTARTVDVKIADDDLASVLLSPASGLTGTEGGAAVRYAISLTSQPVDTVTVSLAGDADGAPLPDTHVFDATNWSVPRDVDVAIVQDRIAEGTHATTITGTIAAGGDATYAAVVVPDQVIEIADDDTAGVTFSPPLPGPLSVVEGGAAATYDVVLDSQPLADVTVTIASLHGQVVLAPGVLTFTPATWDVPQAVQVTALDDAAAEPDPQADQLLHAAGGDDPTYAGLALGDMDVVVGDDDPPGIRIDATLPDTSVDEGGVGDQVQVVLEREPTGPVEVTLSVDAQVRVDVTTLTFGPTDWDRPRAVQVDAVDDDVAEGPHVGTIHALAGSVESPAYAGVSASHVVQVADDDVAGVLVTPPLDPTLSETTPAVTSSYAVRLSSEPLAPVDVLVRPDGQVAATPTTLTFTPADWDQERSVAVSAIDDALPETDPHVGTVTHDSDSSDPAYGAGVLAIDEVTFQVADDDTPGIAISPTGGHVVAEGGATSSYEVVLRSRPSADVVLAPRSDQLRWSVPQLTFSPANWNEPQVVTLVAIDDRVDEPSPHPGSLRMSVTSDDAGYSALVPDAVDAQVTDDDESDLVVTAAGSAVVDEAATMPAASYRLTLTSIPDAPVVVTVGPDPQVATSVATATLDATNWETGIVIDVTAVDDRIDEGPHRGVVGHAMASSDPDFDGEVGPEYGVDVVDDDVAGVTITHSGADTTVAEDGSAVDDYAVVLDSQPVADVVVTIDAADGQVAATPHVLTFTQADWDRPQLVDVIAVDDAVVEGAHTGTLRHVAASGDPRYEGVAIADLVANVLDDDSAGVEVTPDGGAFALTEGGAGDRLVVTLTSQPVAPVTIDLSHASGQLTLGTPRVVLDATNWSSGAAVAVEAVDDPFVEGPHTGDVEFAIDPSSDPAYVAEPVVPATADITDDDTAAVLVDVGDGIALDEAAAALTDTFTVRLQASPAPGQHVDVDVAEVAPGGQVTLSPATITFDAADWDVPQEVTVGVVDDDVDEASPHAQAIGFRTTSGDPDFEAIATASVDAAIADDDESGLLAQPSRIAVAEADATSAEVQVSLTSRPVGTVEVAIAGDAQVTTAPAGPLTFDAATWDVPQAVTVTAVDDRVDEDDPHPSAVTLDMDAAAAGDAGYAAAAPVDVAVDVSDDDDAALVMVPIGEPLVDESDPATTTAYDVSLATQPTGTVTATATPDGQLAVVSGGTLTFTPTTWSEPQRVVVHAVDDDVDEPSPHDGLLVSTVDGADPRYAALAAVTTAVGVLDDDTAGVVVDQGPSPQQLAEDGAGGPATYTVVLASQPTADVVVTVDADGQVDAGPGTQVTFKPADWDRPRQVEVVAVDDEVAEASPHPGVVGHGTVSTDPSYAAAAIAVDDARFEIDDDDVAGFTFEPVAPAPAVQEAGATSGTYLLSIDTVPADGVLVELRAAGGDVTVSPARHAFTAANAGQPVEVTVSAVDDALVEGAHEDVVSHAVDAAASDDAYDAVAIADVTVAITDDDVAGVVVDVGDGVAVDEADPVATDRFTVALAAEPRHAVDVAVATPDGQVRVHPSTITFAPGDWDRPRTVEVAAVDDSDTEDDPHTGRITIDTASTDRDFDGLSTADVVARVADDDAPVFIVTDPADLAMDEADAAGTERAVNVRLAATPSAPVVVDASTPDGQLAVQSMPTITLDSSNWSVGVDVLVRPVDDRVDERDPHDGVLAFAVDPASDPAYASLSIRPRTFAIADDDVAGVTVAQVDPPQQLAEDDPSLTATYTLRLDSEPTAPVTVDLTDDGQVTATPASVTFDAGSWDRPAPITVSAVDDGAPEADGHAGTVSHSVRSVDPSYDGISVADARFVIDDDDELPAVLVSEPEEMTLAEADGGLERTLLVRLATAPSATVTVRASNNGQVLFGVSPTLTFTTANWSQPQRLAVRVLDDLVAEGPHEGVVRFTVTSDDADYDGIVVPPRTFPIEDDDLADASLECLPGPGWELVDGRLRLHEDPTSPSFEVSCSVQLGTEAVRDVRIDVAVTPGSQASAIPARVVIPAGSQGPEQLRIRVTDDAFVEGTHAVRIEFDVSSDDPVYDAATLPAIDADIVDDDVAGVLVEPATVAIAEGGGGAATSVRLRSRPYAPVSIEVLVDAQVTASPRTLTFAPEAWNRPQAVTVTAVDDPDDEPDGHAGTVGFTVTSEDPAYAAATPGPVRASIADNDTSAVVVTPTGGGNEVTEGGAGDRMSIRLATRPLASVKVRVAADAQVAVGQESLTFTPADWNVEQVVDVTAVQDRVVEGDHAGTVTFAVESSDVSYGAGAATPAPQQVVVHDDDTAAVTIVERDGRTEVAEAGATDTYTVVLAAQPSGDVVVNAVADAQVTALPAALTFTPANWETPQQVTVSAVQDALDEVDPHKGELTHRVATSAPGWASVKVASVTAIIADDDTAGVVVTQTNGATKVTEGAKSGDELQLRLTSQPTGDVSIGVVGDKQVAVPERPVVFTTTNWREAQRVEVTAVDDREFEGDHEGTVTFRMGGADAAYSKVVVAAVRVAVTDNDVDGGINDIHAEEDEEEQGTRPPRTSPPPARIAPKGERPARREERRSEAGATRTEAGRTRTPEGSGLPSTPPVRERPTPRIGAEVVNARAAEPPPAEEGAEEQAPGGTFARAAAWMGAHWKLWAPLLTGIGGIVGAAAHILRNDPARKAQRSSGRNGRSGGASSSSRDPQDPRRPKGGRRKRDDEDETPRRRPPGR